MPGFQELADYAVATVGLQSVEDFVNLATQAGYETELNTVLVEPCAATKNNALALSRVRAAWRAARAQVLKALLKKSQGLPSEDMDEPLEASTQDSLLQQWQKKYSLELCTFTAFRFLTRALVPRAHAGHPDIDPSG